MYYSVDVRDKRERGEDMDNKSQWFYAVISLAAIILALMNKFQLW